MREREEIQIERDPFTNVGEQCGRVWEQIEYDQRK